MMRNILISLIFFWSIVAQISFLPNFFPNGIVPNIALVIIVIWVVKTNFNAVFKWAIIVGIMMDIMLFYPIGVNVLVFVLVIFIINSLSKRFLSSHNTTNIFTVSAMIAIGTTVDYAGIFFLNKLIVFFGKEYTYSQHFFDQNILLKLLNNIIIFLVCYQPFKKISKIFTNQSDKLIIR